MLLAVVSVVWPVAAAPPSMPAPSSDDTVTRDAVETTDQLRAIIASSSSSGASVDVWVMPGAILKLGGTPLVIHGFNMTLQSEGVATIDAEGLSSLLVSQSDRLELHSMVLQNGWNTTPDAVGTTAGGVSVDMGVLLLGNCTITNCTAVGNGSGTGHQGVFDTGGGILVEGGLLILSYSRVESCHASTTVGAGGGLFVGIEGRVVATGSRFSNCQGIADMALAGGALFVYDGTLALSHTTIVGCSASVKGTGSACTGSASPGQNAGGGICILGGHVMLSYAEIVSCTASLLPSTSGSIGAAGGVEIVSQARVNIFASKIINCSGESYSYAAGALDFDGGSVELIDSMLMRCTAMVQGYASSGGILDHGGSGHSVKGCFIVHCVAHAQTKAGGGLIFLTGGSTTINNSTLEGCAAHAASAVASAMYIESTSSLGATLTATLLRIVASDEDCSTAIIALGAELNVFQARSLKVKLPTTCAPSALSRLLPAQLQFPRCGADFTLSDGQFVSVCGQNAECIDMRVANTDSIQFTSPVCTCSGGTYAQGGLAVLEHELAPYDRGCLERVSAIRLYREVEGSLAVSLRKNEKVAESRLVNLTLELSGTDWLNGSNYTWVVADANPRSWLSVERTTGLVSTTRQGAQYAQDSVPVLLQSTGLRDGDSETAVVTVTFFPHASVEGESGGVQVLYFSITVYVSAIAVPNSSSFEEVSTQAVCNHSAKFLFVARDIDGDRLGHGEVPLFSANVIHKRTGQLLQADIEYVYNGSYAVHVTPTRLGLYEAVIWHSQMDGKVQQLPSVLHIDVGCREGTFLASGACLPCPLIETHCSAPYLTLETLTIAPNYWRTSERSEDILRCRVKGVCIQNGSRVCAEERLEGSPLCDVCARGYYRSEEDECIACNKFKFSTALAWLGISALLSLLLIIRPSRRSLKSTLKSIYNRRFADTMIRLRPKLRIGIALYQVIQGIGRAFKLSYPPGSHSFLRLISIWECFTLPDVGCVVELNWDDRMLLQTLVPTGFLVCLGALWQLTRNHSLVEVAYAILFLVYPAISAAAFETFDW